MFIIRSQFIFAYKQRAIAMYKFRNFTPWRDSNPWSSVSMVETVTIIFFWPELRHKRRYILEYVVKLKIIFFLNIVHTISLKVEGSFSVDHTLLSFQSKGLPWFGEHFTRLCDLFCPGTVGLTNHRYLRRSPISMGPPRVTRGLHWRRLPMCLAFMQMGLMFYLCLVEKQTAAANYFAF
jgi:hypothetical protein